MRALGKIFFTGMLISFLGSLPLGTLNVAAMQISITEGYTKATMFSIGSLVVEMIFVRLSLVGMDWVRKQQKILKMLEWVTLAIVVALAVSSFYAALHPKIEKNVFLSSTLPRFVLGAIMCAVNPIQIPFWFGWSTVLFSKKVLLPRNDHYNAYIIGIGLGTLFGNYVFIFGGQLIVSKLNTNQNVINWIIGGIFGLTALIQIYRMFFSKNDVHHRLEHLEEETHGLEKKIT
jgi:threonine/homoserine/homoserine lactone efflux protein